MEENVDNNLYNQTFLSIDALFIKVQRERNIQSIAPVYIHLYDMSRKTKVIQEKLGLTNLLGNSLLTNYQCLKSMNVLISKL